MLAAGSTFAGLAAGRAVLEAGAGCRRAGASASAALPVRALERLLQVWVALAESVEGKQFVGAVGLCGGGAGA